MKIMKKANVLIIALAMIAIMLPITAMADGSYYVDSTYVTLKEGDSGTITITADNAAGRVDWSGSGSVSASGSAYLDNGVATIDFTAVSAGTGYITVVPTDIATYDGEEIGYSYTIQVDVIGDNAADNVQDEPVADDPDDAPAEVQEQPAQDTAQNDTEDNDQNDTADNEPETEAFEAPQNEKVLTDGNKDYADLDEEDRLYTDVDGQELYIIQFPRWLNEFEEVVWNDEVYGLDLLEGFDLVTVNYKDMDVDTFQYRDMLNVFVLKNLETDESNYYLLEDGEGFTQLKYITANGKQYIVVDFPKDFQVPSGYQMVELSFGNTTVQALKKVSDEAVTKEPETEAEEEAQEDEEADEEDEEAAVEDSLEGDTGSIIIDKRTKVMLNGYETEISPGLDSDDPTSDIYYIYCLVDGKTQLYSYDSGENTLQRASLVVYNEVPTEPQTVIVYETQPEPETVANDGSFLKGIGWNNMQIQVKVLLIALAVAIILIIVLIILFASMSRKNRKKYKSSKNSKANKKNSKANRKSDNKKAGEKTSSDDIPDRTYDKSSEDDMEESFFSYVKTEKDSINMDDLDL